MNDFPALHDKLQSLISKCNFRAPSLIVSVLGDSIAPHGGTFWMGSLIELMAPLGVNERLVRTATFRLTREDWLVSQAIGRRSYYSLTQAGVKSFKEAFHRVYDIPDQTWNGQWCVVILNGNDLTQVQRDKVRAELSWLGFGSVSPAVFAHPTLNSKSVRDRLIKVKATDQALIMHAHVDQISEEKAVSDFIRRCWDIDQLGQDYQTFLDRFHPLWRLLKDLPAPAPAISFLIRTILIHEYRRLTLRDPQLPGELLSPEWAGASARILCRNIYRLVEKQAEAHLLALVKTADGPLPDAEPEYFSRFGGLH